MKWSALGRTLLLFTSLGLAQLAAGAVVDHFAFTPIAPSQRIGVPLAVTVRALDSNGVVVTNFSGPVQLFFADHAAPVYFNDFANSFNFDTDGDGTSDGANWKSISGNGLYDAWYGFTLASNTTYSVSLDQAMNPSGASAVLVGLDAVMYFGINPWQIGAWGGWYPPNQVARFSVYLEFTAAGEGAHTLDLRYWLPFGGSASIYTDNIRVRVREISPGLVTFQQGQWTGNLETFRPGTNLVLRALNNAGKAGDSNPFDVLPRVADVSVALLPHEFLPCGQWARIYFAVSNAGPSSIEGVVITNEIPGDLGFVDTEPFTSHTVESNRVVSFLPAIAGGTTLTFDLLVQSERAGVAPVTAALGVPAYDTNPSNHTAAGSVTFVPVLTGADVTVTETPHGTNASFEFQLNTPAAQDLVLHYTVAPISAAPGTDFTLQSPGEIIFPMGRTQQSLVVPVLDDVFHESPEQFSLTLSATNLTPVILNQTNFLATIVDDDPLPTLRVSLPINALETGGTLSNAGSFTISAPFEEDIQITVTSSDQSEVLSPGTLVLRAGQTNATFNLPVVDDLIYDPNQIVPITASCTNGMSGAAQMAVLDNELPNLTITQTLKFNYNEGAGTLTNNLCVNSPLALATNLVIALASSDPTELLVPASVTLLAGATFTNFSPTIVDDADTDGPQPVTLSAGAPGFTSSNLNLTVFDNDLHHFAVNGGQNGLIGNQTSTVPFSISVTAKDVASNTLSGFTQAVALNVLSDLGGVVFTPTNTPPFIRGSWFGSLTISNGDHVNVRIVATETNGGGHSGQSNPFRVFAHPTQQLRILGAQFVGADVHLSFNSVTGRHYRVEAADVLAGGAWNVVASNLTGIGGAMPVTNPGGYASPRQFHRVVLQP